MKPHSKLPAVTTNGSKYTSYADPAANTDEIFKHKHAICHKETQTGKSYCLFNMLTVITSCGILKMHQDTVKRYA
jgi:hypothetical protein